MKAPRWPAVLSALKRHAPSVLALVLLGMVYFLGIRSERTGFVDQVLDPSLKRITSPVLNAFRATPPKIPQVTISLTPGLMDSLLLAEQQALERGWMEPESAPWLFGLIAVDSDTQSVRIRPMEGPVHDLQGGSWSYNLALERPDSTLHGQLLEMIPVQDGGAVHALLLEAVLRELGIPQPVRSLADVAIGPRSNTLYMVTPVQDSALLAHWGLGSGPIFSFDDHLRKHARSSMSEFVHPVDAPLRTEWLSAPLLQTPLHGIPRLWEAATARLAASNLEAFRSGSARASEVFDVERTARLMAACDVFGAQPTMRWWNLRFLPDTATGKLVLAPVHLIAGEAIASLGVQHSDAPIAFPSAANSLVGRILGDSEMFTHYMAWLDTLSNPTWLEAQLKQRQEIIDKADRVVRGELPSHRFDPTIIPHNARLIRKMLAPDLPLLAYIRPAQHGHSQVAMANVHDLPLEVIGYVTGSDTVRLSKPLLLLPREPERPLRYVRMTIPDGASMNTPTIMVTVPGTGHTATVRCKPALVQEATQ